MDHIGTEGSGGARRLRPLKQGAGCTAFSAGTELQWSASSKEAKELGPNMLLVIPSFCRVYLTVNGRTQELPHPLAFAPPVTGSGIRGSLASVTSGTPHAPMCEAREDEVVDADAPQVSCPGGSAVSTEQNLDGVFLVRTIDFV